MYFEVISILTEFTVDILAVMLTLNSIFSVVFVKCIQYCK